MNEKEKAEAYVRSKCPELMELSFGCEVKKSKGRGDVWKMVHHNTGRGIGQKYHFLSWGGGSFWSTSDKEDFEIIGHPIQLQHYLQILDEIADKQKVIYRLINCRVLYFGKVIVKFHQKTGQPEDEEDWKAFNQIVGI